MPTDKEEQEERRQTLLNDARVARERNASTYHQFATDEADTPRGRYATVEKASVIGVSPPSYPEQPATSPFHHDPVPPEPPLGFSVDQMEPVGTAAEVEASVAAQQTLEPSPFSSAQGNSPSPASDVDPSSPLDVERRDAGLGLSSQQDDGNA